jgi:hypothetical protein
MGNSEREKEREREREREREKERKRESFKVIKRYSHYAINNARC